VELEFITELEVVAVLVVLFESVVLEFVVAVVQVKDLPLHEIVDTVVLLEVLVVVDDWYGSKAIDNSVQVPKEALEEVKTAG